MHDGYDRLGMVYEARGDKKRAAECYREVSAFVREHPDGIDPEFADLFRNFVERLGLVSSHFASVDDRELRPTTAENAIPLERRGEILDLASQALEQERIP